MMELGGNIKLVGFKDRKRDELAVVKKMVGSYSSKLSTYVGGSIDELSLNLKLIGGPTDGSNEKFQINVKLVYAGNKVETSEVVDRNLFICMDSALKKIETLLRGKYDKN